MSKFDRQTCMKNFFVQAILHIPLVYEKRFIALLRFVKTVWLCMWLVIDVCVEINFGPIHGHRNIFSQVVPNHWRNNFHLRGALHRHMSQKMRSRWWHIFYYIIILVCWQINILQGWYVFYKIVSLLTTFILHKKDTCFRVSLTVITSKLKDNRNKHSWYYYAAIVKIESIKYNLEYVILVFVYSA